MCAFETMYKMWKSLAVLLLVVNCVLSWKPIVSPSSFSIQQHHPSHDQQGGGHNILQDSDAGSTHSITYHGNSFLDNHAQGHDSFASEENDDDVRGYEGESEGRILHSFGGGSTYNHGFGGAPVGSLFFFMK